MPNGMEFPSLVKSVQRFTITITGATSNTATIAAVVTANARLRKLGYTFTGTAGSGDDSMVRLEFTNTTTITAFVNTSPGADSVTVSGEVIEYVAGVLKSVQRGTITNNATATIAAVNTSRTELDFLGNTTAGGAATNDPTNCYQVLTDSTTVTQVTDTEAANVGGYQVVEYY